MRKKILVLVSIFFLIISFCLINGLQSSNFNLFNRVSRTQAERLQSSLEKKEELSFTALLCNETRVPFDDVTNTFYVPVDMEKSQWEKLEFVSGQPEYQVLFLEDITENDKQESIAGGRRFELLVYDAHSWASYGLTFTGLPIIDLATNEGFYAADEITGSAVFYDTDFLSAGTQNSAYRGHIRGNTSRLFPKKGYKLNLITENESGDMVANKLSLFDLRKDNDWMLYAIYNDDTKIRDLLSMKVWEMLGATAVSENSFYGPKMTYVEVFADNQYCGLYGLMEPVDAKQLDLTEEDYSYKRKNPGGIRYQYFDFLECEDPTAEIEGFELKEGKINERSWAPMADLSAFLTLSEEEIVEREQDIINEDSLLRTWLFLQLITGHDHTAKNMFYVAKYDASLKYDYQFYFAPWDLDLTWGNVSVGEENPLFTEYNPDTADDRIYWETADWMIDSDYHHARDRVLEMYRQLRTEKLTDQALEDLIQELDGQLRGSGAFARDEARWPEGAHAKDCNTLVKYAKERLQCLDRAIENFEYFDQ